MSEIRVNNITNRDGTAGPSIAGIPVVDSNSHFVVPTGRTGQRYADGGENIVRDGLVLHLDAKYSYPGATGTNPDVYTWYDMSGNGNDGELKNGVSYSGTNGGSLSFDGSNDYISVSANTQENNPFIEDFSIECWYYPKTNTGGYGILFETQGYRDATGGLAIYRYDDYFRIWRSNHSIVSNYTEMITTNSGTLGLNTWKHFTLTRLNGTLKFYIDTQLQDDVFGPDNDPIHLEPFNYNAGNPKNLYNLGGGRTQFFFNCNIAVAKIYDKALTAAEVSQNFEALRSRFGI